MENKNSVSIKFPCIEFTDSGIYEYTISETTQSGGGWMTDSKEYPVIITMSNDGEGHLKSDVEYPKGSPKFENTYTPAPISVTLIAHNTALGAPIKEGQFRFGVFDNEGNEITYATNSPPKEEDWIS